MAEGIPLPVKLGKASRKKSSCSSAFCPNYLDPPYEMCTKNLGRAPPWFGQNHKEQLLFPSLTQWNKGMLLCMYVFAFILQKNLTPALVIVFTHIFSAGDPHILNSGPPRWWARGHEEGTIKAPSSSSPVTPPLSISTELWDVLSSGN